MRKVNIAEAKARLPELVERAAAGEEIILARHGKPKARLVAFDAPLPAYVMGAGKGKWKGAEEFLERPLPEALIEAFYATQPKPVKGKK